MLKRSFKRLRTSVSLRRDKSKRRKRRKNLLFHLRSPGVSISQINQLSRTATYADQMGLLDLKLTQFKSACNVLDLVALMESHV